MTRPSDLHHWLRPIPASRESSETADPPLRVPGHGAANGETPAESPAPQSPAAQHYGPVAALSRYILSARREVTILFTDIEGSTRYWDQYGDLQGRLMIDYHNRLAFPVVRHFRGRIVKTIGDSIMAMFRDPEDATRAAIAIQQLLLHRRQQDGVFDLHVRIGIHTGTALVERRDVFGDVVNLAARLENMAEGDQILISDTTAARLDREIYFIHERGRYRTRGRRQPVKVWACQWHRCVDLASEVGPESLLPLAGPQRTAIALYGLISMGGLYLLYYWYGRYILSDREWIALLALNPIRALQTYWYVPFIAGATLVGLGWLLNRIRTLPLWVPRLVQGGAGMTLGLLLGAAVGSTPPISQSDWWNKPLYTSDHIFVEVRAPQATVRFVPSLSAGGLMTVNRGELMLLADVERHDGITWNRVLIDDGAWGWVPRVLPPARGHPEKRVTWADKFHFRRGDAYILLAGIIGLVVGTRRFLLRPF